MLGVMGEGGIAMVVSTRKEGEQVTGTHSRRHTKDGDPASMHHEQWRRLNVECIRQTGTVCRSGGSAA